MSIKPKYDMDNFHDIATRKFTDREFYVDTFERCLDEKLPNENKVINFYGMGGIGKTSLQRKIKTVIDDKYPHVQYETINFEDTINLEKILLNLRVKIGKKYKYGFPMFDIVYMMFLLKKYPDVDMKTYSSEWLNNSNVISDIISIVGDIPLVSLPAKLLDIGMKLGSFINNKIISKSNELFRIEEMSYDEIFERLPLIFAEDLKSVIHSKRITGVFFIDTYELLDRKTSDKIELREKEMWIIELVCQLPQILWIICGREKLQWEKYDTSWENTYYFESHCINGFTSKDATNFLKSCQIDDDEIIDNIISCCKGVPYRLDLSVDTYFEIIRKENRRPTSDDFSRTNELLYDRLSKFLHEGERQVIEALAAAEVWDESEFRMFIMKLNINYSGESFDQLCRFSFILNTHEGKYIIHELMRSTILSQLEEKIIRRNHLLLIEYYEANIGSFISESTIYANEEFKDLFSKLFASAEVCFESDDLFDWSKKYFDIMYQTYDERFTKYFESIYCSTSDFDNKRIVTKYLVNIMENYGRYQKCIDYIDRVKKDTKMSKDLTDLSLDIKQAKLLLHQGQNEVSKCIIDNLLEENSENLDVQNLLATYHMNEENYKSVIEVYENIIIDECIDLSNMQIGTIYNNLGLSYMKLRQFSKAIEMYVNAINKRGSSLKKENAITYSNLGIAFRKSKNIDKAIDAYNTSIELFKNSIGEENKYIADVYSNLALVYAWMDTEYQKKAIKLYTDAIRIMSSSIGEEHHYISGIYFNRGKLLYHMGQFNDAFEDTLVAYNIRYNDDQIEHNDEFSYLLSVSQVFEKAGQEQLLKEMFAKVMSED